MPLNTKTKIRRSIFNIFTKKYGLHVQTAASNYLEPLLENEPNLVDYLERLIKAYKKRYEDNPKVMIDEESLKEVVIMLQASSAAAAATPFQKIDEEINSSLQDMSISQEPVDIQQHFHVIDAFDIPQYKYDEHRKNFNLSKEKPSLLAPPKKKGDMFRERLLLIKQRLLRNEMFSPDTMATNESTDSLKIKPIKSLIGHDRESFLLFGMLTQLEEGKFFLEDEDANIELNLNEAKFDHGLFTDGSFVLAEGVYGDDHIFYVMDISLPPPEPRNMTDAIFSHIDFTGLPKPLIDEKLLKIEEEAHGDITFAILSDVHLDQPHVMRALREIFTGYSSTQIPFAFIFIGNFQSKPFIFSGIESDQYRDNFSALADLISGFPDLATHSNFVFVPGPNDPFSNNVLPQEPIPSAFVNRIKQKVKKATFATNPCRIRYCTQDIVIFREDLLSRLWRNTILSPSEEASKRPTKELVRTIMDQGHLCPLPLSVRPTYWAYDHALSLYPLPHTVVLADKCEEFNFNYEGTHCLNPSSFESTNFTWTLYYPALRQSEKCILERR